MRPIACKITTVFALCLSCVHLMSQAEQPVYAYQTGDTKDLSRIAIEGIGQENTYYLISDATFRKNSSFLPMTKKAKKNRLFFNFDIFDNNRISYYRKKENGDSKLINTLIVSNKTHLEANVIAAPPGSKIKLTDDNIQIVKPSKLRRSLSKLGV